MSWTPSKSTHVARKAHRCYLCAHAIPVGATYTKRVGKTDGDFWAVQMHPFCDEVAHIEYDHDAWEFHDPFEFRDTLARHEAARAASL